MHKAFSKIWLVFIFVFIVGGFLTYYFLKVHERGDAWYKQQAIKNNDPSFCEKIKNTDLKDECYLIVAQQIKDISLCEKISKTSTKTSCFSTLKERITSKNKVSITHTQENNKNTLLFEINFENYSLKSVDLSHFGPNFSQYGSQMIVPPKFNFSPKFPFLRIETRTESGACEPRTPDLKIEVHLPLNSETKVELVDFKEKKIEERLEIVPAIICIEMENGCRDCPNYLKEAKFFPSEFSVWPDKSRLEEKETLRVSFPLFRHNPRTRETYRIEKAKIRVDYTLPEYSLLILERREVPSEIDTETFNVNYKVINPTLKEFKDLKIKIDLDEGALVSYSPEFDIEADSIKIISFKVKSLWYPGNVLMVVSVISDSRLFGIGSAKWVKFLEREGQTVEPTGLIELNFKNFSKKTKSGIWAVYFWQPDCRFCGAMKPILEELAKEVKEINFGKVNIKENPKLLKKFYKFIYGISGILLIKDGKVIDSKMGRCSKQELKTWLFSK